MGLDDWRSNERRHHNHDPTGDPFHPPVPPGGQDCFIAPKNGDNGVVDLVAYVVANGSFDEAVLADFVRPSLPAETQSLTFVEITSLPPVPDIAGFNTAGAAVLDDELVNAWQRMVDSSFGTGRLQVGIGAAQGSQGTIRIVNETPPLQSPECGDEDSSPSVVGTGLVDGGTIDVKAPKTMVELLLRAADHDRDRAIIHVDADGVERLQTYRDLLADACRVAQGLGLLGLVPGDTVLLQLGSSHQFFTGLWGCLLGGYVPALVDVPADYVEEFRLQQGGGGLGRPAPADHPHCRFSGNRTA